MTLNSQGDTNLLGSQIKGNTVNANVGGKLNIESLQDEERFKTKSSGGGLEGEFGFGNNWSLSGYGNASKGTTHRKQVNEQAGIFAEDGGYHINADSVHLKGGAIASTNPTNSKLATNKLTFEDIQNESSSSAASASISGSLKESKEKWVDNETGSAVKPNTENSTKLDSQRSGGISPGLPMFERDSDSSVTRATLTEGTIILNKDTHPTVTTAKELGINTDLAQANNQVAQTKDVKAQLQGQQQIATAIGNVKSAVDTYTSNKQEEAEQEVRRLESQKQRAIAQGNAEALIQINRDLNSAKEAARDWGTSGSYKRIADTVTNVLTSAIAGAPTEAIATTAVSPWVNQEIKRLTTDKTTGEVDKTTNAIAHAVWGAIEAAATKGNVTAGAIAGASSELAAPLIAKALYGTDDPKQLTEVQKQNIVNLSSLAGAIGAGIANGNGSGTEVLTSANQGAEIGKRAVENNYLSIADVQNFIRELSKAQKEGRDTKPILEKYKGISEENRQQLIACKGNVACETAHLHEMNTGAEELERNLGFFSRMTVYYPNDLNTANRIALSNLVERENAESFSKLSDTTKFGLNAMEAGTAIGLGAAAGSAKVGLSNVKSLISGKNKAYPTSGMDGYKRTNVGDEDYPEGIHFSMNLKNHLIQGEGINQRRGVAGGHNRENFLNTLSQGDGRIVKEESTNVDGITRIHYEIPRLGRDGKPDGTYKAISSPKTVYDPIKFSDHEMLEMGQKAVAKGYVSSVKASNDYLKNYQDSQQINGIKFRYYIDKDTKGVTNVHPE